MTPFEFVCSQFQLPKELHGQPFEAHPLQIAAVNALAENAQSGVFLDTGTGKTLVETLLMLYRMATLNLETGIVIMPPILVSQWGRWLANIRHADGRPLRVTQYQGTPAQRKALPLGVDVVLVGIQIFKRDYQRFRDWFDGRRYTVAIDEANMLCNVGSDNHEKVYEFCLGVTKDLLTGTPMNVPTDAYGIMKFTAPGLYRNLKHFQNMHVDEVDFYGNPSKYTNLDVLKRNLETNSYRILFEDMYPDVDVPLFNHMPYELAPAHMKLYRRLVDEQMVELDDGGKLDFTQANRVIHALGQVIINWGYFAQDSKLVSEGVALVEQRLSEVSKLVVFANYRMTVSHLVQRFPGAAQVNSEVTAKEKADGIDRFINDPRCKLAVIHPKSGGAGLDGLQHVCNHMMFLEPLASPRDFHQCVARLKRTGQRRRVVVDLPTAEGTLQGRSFAALQKNDNIVGSVVRTAFDLRALLRGEQT